MRAVNLLPRETAKPRRQLRSQSAPALVGAGLGIFVAGALALGFFHETSAVSSAQARLQEAKTVLSQTPKPPQASTKPEPNAQLAAQESARIVAVSIALGTRVAWDRILRELSLVLPDDVSVTSLTLAAPTTTATATTTPTGTMTIAGATYSHDSVARLISRLALIPELTDVSLQSDSSSNSTSAPGQTSGPSLVEFTIAAGVKPPVGAISVTAPPPAPPVTTNTSATTTTGAGQ